MFEKASRLRLRFSTGKGVLTVEDLWDLPLTSAAGHANLDDIARGLYKKLQEEADISFVNKEKPKLSAEKLQFEIVKHVIEVRLAENEERAKARENSEKKQRILGLIAEKQEEVLKGKSLDELKAMVAELT